MRSFKLIDGSPCVVNVHVYSFFSTQSTCILKLFNVSISSRCLFFFFAVQTVCMGTRCWTVGSRSAPPTPRRGCWTTAVRPVGTTSCPPRPPAPTVLLCQVRKIQFMTPWNSCHYFIVSCEHSQKV